MSARPKRKSQKAAQPRVQKPDISDQGGAPGVDPSAEPHPRRPVEGGKRRAKNRRPSRKAVPLPAKRRQSPPADSGAIDLSGPPHPRRTPMNRAERRASARPGRSPGLYLELRGTRWWIYGSYRGRRIRISTFETDYERAEIMLTQKRREMEDSYDLRGKIFKKTFGEACTAYLKWKEHSKAQQDSVELMRKHIGSATLCEDIDQDMLDGVGEDIMKEDSTQQSFKRRIVVPVKAILNYAAGKWGLKRGCPPPNFPRIPDGERRKIVVTPRQAQELIDGAVSKGWHLLVLAIWLGANEGMRRGEMFNLLWRAFNADRGSFVLRDTKARPEDERDRFIDKLRPGSIAALLSYRTRCSVLGEHVFCDTDGTRFADVGSFGNALNKQLEVLRQELGLPYNVTLHVFRHSAASWAYRVSKDIEAVRVWMDWRSMASVLRYIHLMLPVPESEILAFWDGRRIPDDNTELCHLQPGGSN